MNSNLVSSSYEILAAVLQLHGETLETCDDQCRIKLVKQYFPETEELILDVVEHNDKCKRFEGGGD